MTKNPMPQSPALPRVAYLTGQYPEVSLTFILREVEALRALGMDVRTCSIRRTPPEQHPGPAEKEAARTTFHVLEAVRNPLRLIGAQLSLLRHPGRYFGALALAFKMRSPGIKSLLYQLIFFAEATILACHLSREGVQHLHNHFTFGSATVAMLVSKLIDIPFSFTLHGPADLLEPYRWRIDEKTARARFVATISHYARSQIMFFSDPAHWDKIRIIHCGVEPARWRERRCRPEKTENSVCFSWGVWLRLRGCASCWRLSENWRRNCPACGWCWSAMVPTGPSWKNWPRPLATG